MYQICASQGTKPSGALFLPPLNCGNVSGKIEAAHYINLTPFLFNIYSIFH